MEDEAAITRKGAMMNGTSLHPSPSNDEDLFDRARDFSDIIELAQPNAPHFKLVSHDEGRGIRMFTRPVKSSPIQLMKASALMPCPPKDLLRYLDMDIRAMWDEHFIEGTVVRELRRKNDVAMSTLPLLAERISSRQVKTVAKERENGASGSRPLIANERRTAAAKLVAKSAPTQPRTPAPALLVAGAAPSQTATVAQSSALRALPAKTDGTEAKIQLKHIAFLSPIPLIMDRDFELVVAEQVLPSGTAVLKAFSTPRGYIKPPVPGYVRGVVSISGFVAEPLRYVDPTLRREVNGSRVTYIALVHPMGLIPPFLVNVVVGKQTSALSQLQEFIARNPLSELLSVKAGELEFSGSRIGEVMRGRVAQHKAKI
jgi:hypothetical protein